MASAKMMLAQALVVPHMQALTDVLPAVARQKTEKGGFMVLRPDSGDPVQAVLMGLEAGEKVFGVDANALGYRVPRGATCLRAVAPHLTPCYRPGLEAC